MSWLTGGADGLQGIVMAPVAGQFAFDLFGRVSYVYAAVVLALGFLVFRSLVDSDFGKSLVGIRENEARMRAIGTPVDARLRTAFVICGGDGRRCRERCRRRSPSSWRSMP